MSWSNDVQITCEDNMELMARYPDNYFDLAIVDPPYGIGADDKNNGKNSDSHEKSSKARIKSYHSSGWDKYTPSDEYFKELKRVSKRQIIWGANYFGLIGGMLYWHKNVTMPTYSSGELAYLSWLNKMDFVEITWHGMLQHNMKDKEVRIHPTQKPVALYQWLLTKYAKPGDKILDTHIGSGSIAIAVDSVNKVENMNLTLTGCELDPGYYEKAMERFKQKTAQTSLFAEPQNAGIC